MESGSGAPLNRVDNLANALHREGHSADLEAELQKLDRGSLTSEEQESWWHLYGIAAFQAGRDDVALARFDEGSKLFPDSAPIRFSLGQQYLQAHDAEKAFALFRASLFPAISGNYALAEARYAYVWSRYNDGMYCIAPILEAYRRLRILDDTFLFIRGVPNFGQTWGYLAAFSILSNDFRVLDDLAKFAAANCTDYAVSRLEEELSAYREDRPELLIPALERDLNEGSRWKLPTGYTSMRIAITKAQSAPSMQLAEAALSGVELSKNDFPWLEDMRTLATAQSAFRFRLVEREQRLVKTFLARQPLLFEPDHALNFQLLRYQERLKPLVTSVAM